MRTNIDIDDKLMKQTMKATGATTKKGAVEASMRLAVQMHKQQKALKGLWVMGWEGDLDEMRETRFPDWDGVREPVNTRKRKSAA